VRFLRALAFCLIRLRSSRFPVHSGRKLTRHETPKRFQLLRIENKDPKEPLLPILSDDPDVLLNHPLREFFINASSSDGENIVVSDGSASRL
jgi:hypothetical protein